MRDKGDKQNATARRNSSELLARTKKFAIAIIKLYSELPSSAVGQVLGRQLLRSATSVGAHYREAQRAKSMPDFISKIEGGLQELDESIYWLELLEESGLGHKAAIPALKSEASELLAIFVAIAKSAKSKPVLGRK